MKRLASFLSVSLLCLEMIAQSPCLLADTVQCGDSSAYNYTYQRTRGFWFQSQSTFSIVGVKAADGNPQGVAATHQSIEIVRFDTMPLTGPQSYNPHSVLFSSINVPHSWLMCNAQIDSGSYYGVIGAKNDSVPWLMYNSYTGGTLKLLMNGDSTIIHRAGAQISLGTGPPQNGLYFDDGLSYIGRIHIMIGTNHNPQVQINQIGLDLQTLVFGGIAPYLFYWNTGESSSIITPQNNGIYWIVVTDANGCVSDTVFFNVTNITAGILEKNNNLVFKKTINLLGEETSNIKKNGLYIYIYDDGKVEKRIIIE